MPTMAALRHERDRAPVVDAALSVFEMLALPTFDKRHRCGQAGRTKLKGTGFKGSIGARAGSATARRRGAGARSLRVVDGEVGWAGAACDGCFSASCKPRLPRFAGVACREYLGAILNLRAVVLRSPAGQSRLGHQRLDFGTASNARGPGLAYLSVGKGALRPGVLREDMVC